MFGSPRAVAVTTTVVLAMLASGLACGPSSSDPGDGDGSLLPGEDGGVTAHANLSTCASDADCDAGKCLAVGGGARACVHARSCTGGEGANTRCGGVPGDESKEGSSSCCETRLVPGGSSHLFGDPASPSKVSPFLLDTFEVTAGRFRAWVEATDGDLRANAPSAGDGAHPRIANSGWRAEWTALLPSSRDEVDRMLGADCQVGSNLDDYGTLTWWTPALDAKIRAANGKRPEVLAENTRAALDGKALVCVPWYVLFAFCVWDGGRLPTNAEWDFAASGGEEERAFPWGAMKDDELASLDDRKDLSRVPTFEAGARYLAASLWDRTVGDNRFPDNYVHTWGSKFRVPRDNAAHVPPVGRKALGNGRWGHADLAGGVYEWLLDEGPVRPGPCVDCGNVSFPGNDELDPNAVMDVIPDFEARWYRGGARVIRGGAWDNALSIANHQTASEIEAYTSYPVRRTYRALGGRCARDLGE